MKADLTKLNGACLETLRDVKLSIKVVYINMTEKSLIMSGSTGEVHWRVCQLGWLVATQTVSVNLNVLNHLLR